MACSQIILTFAWPLCNPAFGWGAPGLFRRPLMLRRSPCLTPAAPPDAPIALKSTGPPAGHRPRKHCRKKDGPAGQLGVAPERRRCAQPFRAKLECPLESVTNHARLQHVSLNWAATRAANRAATRAANQGQVLQPGSCAASRMARLPEGSRPASNGVLNASRERIPARQPETSHGGLDRADGMCYTM